MQAHVSLESIGAAIARHPSLGSEISGVPGWLVGSIAA